MRPKLLLNCCLFLALSVCGPDLAQADMILNSVGTIEWDPAALPGGPGPITISVSANSTPPNDNVLNAFSVGLRFVAEPGATGALRISSVAQPTTDRVFANYSAPLVVALQDSVYSVSGDNAQLENVAITASGRRLFEMFLAPQGANVSGSFLIVADGPKSNYFTTTEFDGLKYGNVGSGDFVLGRVNINVTSVPEPATTLLLSLAGGWLVWRRKR
ncbi:MAG: PEP-CTERM sorting domain-containing protein [Pirellulaceae bacterium]|nr:PEP-CTERM sorting domain-containing protein [Pirellulaceae bacterium]